MKPEEIHIGVGVAHVGGEAHFHVGTFTRNEAGAFVPRSAIVIGGADVARALSRSLLDAADAADAAARARTSRRPTRATRGGN